MVEPQELPISIFRTPPSLLHRGCGRTNAATVSASAVFILPTTVGRGREGIEDVQALHFHSQHVLALWVVFFRARTRWGEQYQQRG